MIDDLNKRGTLGGFNRNKTREVLNVSLDEIINEVDRGRKESRRGVEGGDVDIKAPLRRSQFYEWGNEMHLLP